jgi:hypothetical protein
VQGFAGGAFVNIGIPLMPFSVQAEALYVTKGNEMNYEADFLGGSIKGTSVETLQYIEIPVLAKVNIPIPAPVTPNIYVGPAYSLLIGSKQKVNASFTGFGQSESGDTTITDLEHIAKDDFGVAFGGGVDFNLFVTKVTLDARYTLGLKNIYKRPEDAPQGDGDPAIKNRAWMIMLGVAF